MKGDNEMGDVLDAEIRGVFVDQGTGAALVLLGAVGDPNHVLPIVIGLDEAEAIAVGISGHEVPRPLTHDLLLRAVEAADGSMVRMDVVGLVAGTFLAELELRLADRAVRVDARPSDGIALAVRAGVPIGVDGDLFRRVAVDIVADDDEPIDPERADEIVREFRTFLDETDPSDFGTGGPGAPEPPDEVT